MTTWALATFLKGKVLEVQPHPHAGLSTLTYLIKGSLMHRDSLCNHIEITPVMQIG
ncbi:pirin family protein [Pseudoalteromonas luteoviolacea]|uniref:pirin family protein n=1 Tax=Pseudoalteromonas luteoviolacea TaxID=43657 RepID=UPI001E6457E1|nr:pirin family protein [Pseudoalteromonas luteoviolacea]